MTRPPARCPGLRTRLALGLIAAWLGGGCTLLAIPAAPDWNDAQIDWQPFAAGLERAQRERRPILLLIYTQGCEHGPAYSALFRAEDVVEEAREFVMVRVDADAEPELDARFMPDGPYVPRTFFLDAEGVPAYALHGDDLHYRHFLDTRDASELLMLMRAARRALRAPQP